jgi:hypothetical protein
MAYSFELMATKTVELTFKDKTCPFYMTQDVPRSKYSPPRLLKNQIY